MKKIIRGWRELLKENLPYCTRQNIIMTLEEWIRLTELVAQMGT
jgi:hypothetical protein